MIALFIDPSGCSLALLRNGKKLFFVHSFCFHGSQHDLKPGDNIDIHVQGERDFAIAKAPGARELLASLRKYRGRLPADFKFDRLEANERG
jgi:antitoxin MazE